MHEQELGERGIELIAVSFVDNAGIVRAKTVPAARADAVSRRGVGAPFAFSIFQGNDGMATATGYEATGDARLIPDLGRLAGGVDGWGLAPGSGRPLRVLDLSGERRHGHGDRIRGDRRRAPDPRP